MRQASTKDAATVTLTANALPREMMKYPGEPVSEMGTEEFATSVVGASVAGSATKRDTVSVTCNTPPLGAARDRSTSVRRVTYVPHAGFVLERLNATPPHAVDDRFRKTESACTPRTPVLSKTGTLGNGDVVGDRVWERVPVALEVELGE